ncbi:MAG: hypothetical protein QXU99_00215 [Candidatus Bathyarchaeia archaeon]
MATTKKLFAATRNNANVNAAQAILSVTWTYLSGRTWRCEFLSKVFSLMWKKKAAVNVTVSFNTANNGRSVLATPGYYGVAFRRPKPYNTSCCS